MVEGGGVLTSSVKGEKSPSSPNPLLELGCGDDGITWQRVRCWLWKIADVMILRLCGNERVVKEAFCPRISSTAWNSCDEVVLESMFKHVILNSDVSIIKFCSRTLLTVFMSSIFIFILIQASCIARMRGLFSLQNYLNDKRPNLFRFFILDVS